MTSSTQRETEITKSAARYEFRIWGDDLTPLFARLRESCDLLESEGREETYIVSSLENPYNVKIRDGSLDVKFLVRTLRQLELWRPHLQASFPLSHRTLKEAVGPILSFEPRPVSQPNYGLVAFIQDVVLPCPHLTLARVTKTRHRFRVDDWLAEFTIVTVGQAQFETVAIESSNAAIVLRAIVKFGLCGRKNQNYQHALKSILGLGNTTPATI